MESLAQYMEPALVKIMVVFIALLLMNRRLPLFVCLLFTGFGLGLWMNMSMISIWTVFLREVLAPQTLILALVIILIVIFSGLLKLSGRLNCIVSSLDALSARPGFALAMAPALIGLLPMPGGAVFSAPMVDSVAQGLRIKPELKLTINYWFRHVPEFIWPLYPGFILSLTIFNLDAWRLMVFQIPLSLGSVVAGILFVLPRIPRDFDRPKTQQTGAFRDFLRGTMPITTVLILMFTLLGLIESYSWLTGTRIRLSQHLSMTVALSAGIFFVMKAGSISYEQLWSTFRESGVWSIVLMVFAIMAFKGILEESQTISQIRSELQAYHIPGILIVALLPLIAGLVTGIAVGFVGSAFPLVATIMPANESMMPYVVLAYGFGFMGMMLSPVHLCFLVTQEYFHTNALDSYGYLWRPSVFLLLWIVTVFYVYRMIL